MASPQEHSGNPGAGQYAKQGISSKKSLGGLNDTHFLQDLAECLAGVEAEQKGEERDEAEGGLRDWRRSLSSSVAFTRPDDHHHATDSLGATMNALSAPAYDQKSTVEDNKTRSEAITLIRARTLTRSSPTDSTFQGDMSGQSSSTDSPLPPVNLSQYLEAPKKKKQKKKKKSKKSDSTTNKDSQSANDKVSDDKSDKPNGDQKKKSSSQNSSKPSHDTNGTEVKLCNKARPEPKTKPQDTTVPKTADAKSSVPEEQIFKRPELTLAGSKKNKASQQPKDGVSNPPIPKTKAEILQRQKPEQAPTKPVVTEKKTKANSNGTSAISSTIGPSSQSASSQTPRRSSVQQKEKLSPIREVSPARVPKDEERLSPHHAQQDSTAADAQSLTCTPKSTSTTGLSAWAAFAQQSTPRTDISDTSEPPKPTQALSIDTQTANTPFIGPAPPPPTTVTVTTTTNITTTHAHPSSPQESSTIPTPQTRTQKPNGFFWQLDSHGFPCAKATCDKRCNLWDGATVICPKCGPFSEVRYCTKAHLLEDTKAHWVYCGQMTFQNPCRESSIPRAIREDAVPLLPCLHRYDTPERHRQAVYFNMNSRAGDYFIFADWADWSDAGFPENTLNVRCSSRVVCAISFDDPDEKDRFRRVLATCLFMTIEVHELIDYLYRLLRDHLRARTLTPPVDLENALQYQIHQEFAVTIQPQITGERHACETDWDGRNRRNCPDPVCRAEYRRLLGSLGGKGHRQLVDHLEGCYWLLRAARTTHPTVKKAGERMRGEGFEGVAEEDCREFCRGEGWDGYDKGEMEIEGINA